MSQVIIFVTSDELSIAAHAKLFIESINWLSDQLGLAFSTLGYSVRYEDALEVRERSYESRIGKRSLNKLYSLLAQGALVNDLAVWADSPDTKGQIRLSLYGGIATDEFVKGCRYIYIEFPQSSLEQFVDLKAREFLHKLLCTLNDFTPLSYGLITTMNQDQSPLIFFGGLLTGNLTDQEELDFAVWHDSVSQHRTKLRGLYWGNVIGNQHLAELVDESKFIRELTSIVGDESIKPIDGNALMLLFETPDLSSSKSASEVRELINKNNLLMQPNENVWETVRRIALTKIKK